MSFSRKTLNVTSYSLIIIATLLIISGKLNFVFAVARSVATCRYHRQAVDGPAKLSRRARQILPGSAKNDEFLARVEHFCPES